MLCIGSCAKRGKQFRKMWKKPKVERMVKTWSHDGKPSVHPRISRGWFSLNFTGVLFAIQKPQGNLLMREILTTDWAISNTAGGMNYQLVHDLSINSSFTIEFVSSFSVLHRVKCIEHVGVLGALVHLDQLQTASCAPELRFGRILSPNFKVNRCNRELDLFGGQVSTKK